MTVAELPEIPIEDEAFLNDPHATLREVREQSEIARSSRGIELLSYSLCEQALRDERFAVGFDEMMEATGIEDGPAYDAIVNSINNTEGAEHARLRKAIAPFLAPKGIGSLRERLRELIEARLEQYRDAGECDLVELLAHWLPATTFCLITGAPMQDRDSIWRLSDHAQRFFEMAPLNREVVEAGLAEVDEYMDDLLERRRAEPGEDILSFLIAAQERGDLSDEELRNLATILLAASTDTTSGQLTHTFAALAEKPEQFARLQADPSLAQNAVLETSRHKPSLWTAPRFAREGGSFGGVELDQGAQLNAFFLCANRDPEVFDAPDELVIDRKLARPPLNWSSGRHFCPGRPLAVLEIEEAVRVAAASWREFEVDDVESRGAPYIVAPSKAPIRFVPTKEAP